MPLNNCIETVDYYLYIPDQYIQYISWSVGDQILYFSTTSTVNCLLIYKNSNVLYQCSFGNIYRANSTQYTYHDLSNYYSQSVSVTYGNTTNRIAPLEYTDIVYTNIDFSTNNNLFEYIIVIMLFCSNLLSLFFIISKRKLK